MFISIITKNRTPEELEIAISETGDKCIVFNEKHNIKNKLNAVCKNYLEHYITDSSAFDSCYWCKAISKVKESDYIIPFFYRRDDLSICYWTGKPTDKIKNKNFSRLGFLFIDKSLNKEEILEQQYKIIKKKFQQLNK